MKEASLGSGRMGSGLELMETVLSGNTKPKANDNKQNSHEFEKALISSIGKKKLDKISSNVGFVTERSPSVEAKSVQSVRSEPKQSSPQASRSGAPQSVSRGSPETQQSTGAASSESTQKSKALSSKVSPEFQIQPEDYGPFENNLRLNLVNQPEYSLAVPPTSVEPEAVLHAGVTSREKDLTTVSDLSSGDLQLSLEDKEERLARLLSELGLLNPAGQIESGLKPQEGSSSFGSVQAFQPSFQKAAEDSPLQGGLLNDLSFISKEQLDSPAQSADIQLEMLRLVPAEKVPDLKSLAETFEKVAIEFFPLDEAPPSQGMPFMQATEENGLLKTLQQGAKSEDSAVTMEFPPDVMEGVTEQSPADLQKFAEEGSLTELKTPEDILPKTLNESKNSSKNRDGNSQFDEEFLSTSESVNALSGNQEEQVSTLTGQSEEGGSNGERNSDPSSVLKERRSEGSEGLSGLEGGVPSAFQAEEKRAGLRQSPLGSKLGDSLLEKAKDAASQLQARGSGVARVQINDKELGSLSLSVRMDSSQKLTVEIAAANDQVRAHLESHLEELRKSLEGQKLMVAEIKIGNEIGVTKTNTDSNTGNQDQSQQQSGSSQWSGGQNGRQDGSGNFFQRESDSAFGTFLQNGNTSSSAHLNKVQNWSSRQNSIERAANGSLKVSA